MKENGPLLLILTPGFPEGDHDSSCLPFIQALIRSARRSVPAPGLVVFSLQYPFKRASYAWEGTMVVPFNGKNRGGIARRWLWFRVWRKIKKLHASNRITGILSLWCGEAALLGHRFGIIHRIAHYTWILGQDARAANTFVGKIRPQSEELIAVSDFIADEFFKNFLVRPAHVIPAGVDRSEFGNATYVRTIDILGAGSLIGLKRFDVFIDCIAALKQAFPGVSSVIAGKGIEFSSLTAKATAKGLDEQLLLVGELEHAALLRLMQQAKIFLHPSSYEGFSMACLEALYAGCEVISFCKPMDLPCARWHVVRTADEMVEKARELLGTWHDPEHGLLPYSAEDTARAILGLFSQ